MPAPDPLRDRVTHALADEFSIERELGRGGMGVVFLGRDLRLNRRVAIKVLPDEPTADGVRRARFLREARTAASLSHPHIVPVFRADERDGLAFFVMAFVDGRSLEDRLGNGAVLDLSEGVTLLREAADALGHAHAAGIVHRDVKPANILLEHPSGRVMLTDFGIAQALVPGTDEQSLTRTGQVIGSVQYLSPEQAAGEPLDGRSDLYALGVVAFRAFSGRLPFDGTAAAVLVGHLSRAAPALASLRPDLPESLTAIVDRLLTKDPAGRYADARALQDALAAVGSLSRAVPHPHEAPSEFGDARLATREAEVIWRRAAELQAETTGEVTPGSALTWTGASTFAEAGYTMRQVESAAEEAGIGREFIARALAEPRGRIAEAAEGSDALEAMLIGAGTERMVALRVIDASPATVLRAIGQVLQAPPFDLQLRNSATVGTAGTQVLMFDLPRVHGATATGQAWGHTRHTVGAKGLVVQLRTVPHPADKSRHACEVQLRAEIVGGRRAIMAGAMFFDSMMGLIGGGAGWMVATKIAVTGAAMASWMTGLGGLGLLAGTLGYRAMMRGGLERAIGELHDALDAVVASLRSAKLFGDDGAARGRFPRARDDSDDVIVPVI